MHTAQIGTDGTYPRRPTQSTVSTSEASWVSPKPILLCSRMHQTVFICAWAKALRKAPSVSVQPPWSHDHPPSPRACTERAGGSRGHRPGSNLPVWQTDFGYLGTGNGGFQFLIVCINILFFYLIYLNYLKSQPTEEGTFELARTEKQTTAILNQRKK